jgi:hypothetical protein
MPISRPYDGSPFAETTNQGKQLVVRLEGIAAVLAASPTTATIFQGGNQVTVEATLSEVMTLINQPPVVTPPTPPPTDDLTRGKLRISPQGNAIARELAALNPKGDWVVITHTGGEITWFFTTNQKNPEIANWPYLTTIVGGS